MSTFQLNIRWTKISNHLEFLFKFLIFQEIIEQHVNWAEDYGEWQLKGVAYAGNNINQYSSPRRSARSTYVRDYIEFRHLLNYDDEALFH